MTSTNVKTVAVFGAGLMGIGLAQVLAQNDYRVHLFLASRYHGITQEMIEAASARIEKGLQKAAEKGLIDADKVGAKTALITTTADIAEAAKDTDCIIEAIPEKVELKKELYGKLESLVGDRVILASNTSTISITRLAEGLKNPARFIGMHFFNPVPQMKLVEVIKGGKTSDDTVKTIIELAKGMGKDPILVEKDVPGFVVNRIGFAIFMEASRILEEGITTPDAVDKGVKLGLGHRMGPFETCDLVGLDARINNLNALYEATNNEAVRPPELLKKLVSEGYLGNKPGSKGGYYTYFGIDR